VVAHGRAWSINGFYITEITEWECMGSGDPFARAIMWHGGSLVQAVQCACEHDLYCYEPIVSFVYNKKNKKVVRSEQGIPHTFHGNLPSKTLSRRTPKGQPTLLAQNQ
jgi:hypothetical protein